MSFLDVLLCCVLYSFSPCTFICNGTDSNRFGTRFKLFRNVVIFQGTICFSKVFWYYCLHLQYTVTGWKLLRYTLHNHSEIKSQDVAGALEVWRYGGNSSRAQEDTGLLDKNSQSWFLSTLTLFFPWLSLIPCLLYSHEHAVPSELRRTLGFLTKKPCILLEDRMNPQPFVSLGVASNFCLKQTSTQRQNKSLDPINYSIYQIVNNGFQASISVMLCYTLLALSPWV